MATLAVRVSENNKIMSLQDKSRFMPSDFIACVALVALRVREACFLMTIDPGTARAPSFALKTFYNLVIGENWEQHATNEPLARPRHVSSPEFMDSSQG